MNKQASSENKQSTQLTLLGRLLKYNKNSSRTPMLTSRKVEQNLLMLRNCFVFSKKHW